MTDIYFNGCSFTYGDELKDRFTAWPWLLCEKLGANCSNDAVNGGTNQRTLYQAIKNIDSYEYFIIAWTEVSRFTFYRSHDGKETNFNVNLHDDDHVNDDSFNKWGKDLYKHWYHELFAVKLWLQQVLQLQALFEKHDKKYLMINSMPNLANNKRFRDNHEIEKYIKLIDTNRFYQWEDFSINGYAHKLKCLRGPHGHFLEDGHLAVADILYKHISENGF